MPDSAVTRIVFMGSDAIALPSLNYLYGQSSTVCIQAIYTQPDRARGRGKKVQANAIKLWALEKGIPVYQPESFDEAAIASLAELKADCLLVMAYGHLLPQSVLDLPPLGIYNLHTSLLPELRGPSPIETAVASGFELSGVSLMQLVLKMDAGPLLDQETVAISEKETGGSYREKLAAASARLLERNLGAITQAEVKLTEQDEAQVTYCRLLVKQDGQLDFSQPARVLAQRINGLNPWPGCALALDTLKLKVGLAAWSEDLAGGALGEIVELDESAVSVATAEGTLQLLSLQKPGGKLLPVGSFLRGFPLKKGMCFQSCEMHGLISRKPVSHKRVFQLYKKP